MNSRSSAEWLPRFLRRLLLITLVCLAAGPAICAESNPAKTRSALLTAFQTNLGYCRQWIKASDFKSLTRTVSELPILTAALGRYTADSDRERIDTLRKSVTELAAAAKAEDATGAQTTLNQVNAALDAAVPARPAEAAQAIGKNPAGFGPLMSLIDGTFADAKTAAAVGDSAEAKSNALVLAELGRWLAADRNTPQWREQSNDLVAAAEQAAASQSNDPKEMRAVFHNVYARCEACHALRRPK